MPDRIRLGISTCPNDTFAFHALLQGLVDLRDLEFETELLDIQQLNRGLRGGDFDVAKASFFAALKLSEQTFVLPSGSALGFGVGPLLLAAEANSGPSLAEQLTLCPGEGTTAALLFRLFYGQLPDGRMTRIEHVVFSDIMPRLKQKQADFGVCIHEGRFTWQTEGLHLVEDLGTRWEAETGCPLPLGGILANRSLGHEVLARVQQVIQDSIRFGLDNPTAALPTMRGYAQELNDDILQQHVDLYVNAWTVDLGPIGSQALQELSNRARAGGLLDPSLPNIEVFVSRQ